MLLVEDLALMLMFAIHLAMATEDHLAGHVDNKTRSSVSVDRDLGRELDLPSYPVGFT